MVLSLHILRSGFSPPTRRPGLPATLLAVLALLVPAGRAGAFEKWVVERKLEISGAEGIGFNQPSDVVVLEGKVYVLDAVNNRLCWFDVSGRPLGTTHGSADTSLAGSLGLGADTRGHVFITDSIQGRILTLGAEGRLDVYVTIPKEDKDDPPDPTGLFFFGERLYVVDNDNHVVRIFSQDGKPQGRWGGKGEGFGLFKYPFRAAVDPRGRVGVTDVINSRVQWFTPKGEFLSSFGVTGVVSGTLYRPGGFDIDPDGNVYIADAYFGAVQVFDVDGKLVAILYDRAKSVLTLKNPVAVRWYRGSLFVVEMAADRVSVFSIIKR